MLGELHLLQRFFIYTMLVIVFTLGRFLKVLPFFKSIVSVAMCKMTDSSISTEFYWDSLFTRKMLHNVYHCLLMDMKKKAKLHSRAYNSPLISLDGKRCHRLLDFTKGNRPLVVNFGSSTCPVFMEMLKKYRRLIDQFSAIADFVVVYIEEAHPADGWAFKGNNNIVMHRTQGERCKAAQKIAAFFNLAGCSLTVDTMLNAANIAYGAVPIRLYVIQNGQIVYEGGPGPLKYRMNEVGSWLENYQVS